MNTIKFVLLSFALLTTSQLVASTRGVRLVEGKLQGKLQRLETHDSPQTLSFRCIPASGDIYLLVLERESGQLKVERPGFWTVQGATVKTREIPTHVDHYAYSNGYGIFHYEFNLSIFDDATRPAEFTLVAGGDSLTCS